MELVFIHACDKIDKRATLFFVSQERTKNDPTYSVQEEEEASNYWGWEGVQKRFRKLFSFKLDVF